jgi:hypothetical protein
MILYIYWIFNSLFIIKYKFNSQKTKDKFVKISGKNKLISFFRFKKISISYSVFYKILNHAFIVD